MIIPYFGKFNNYFLFFLESCRNNPTINWLLVTDDKTNYKFPENVKVLYLSFDKLREKFQEQFDFKISLNAPYKLCDFRPAYGVVFKEFTEGYDYWGYCDNDLIFGNIRSFLTDEVISRKDKVLSRGHLSLYRNNQRMNNFFRDETDDFYKTVFTSDRGFSFDEWGPVGIANHIKKRLDPDKFWDELPFDDIHTLRSDFFPAQKIQEDFKYIIYEYENGELFRLFLTSENMNEINREPILYAHFQKRPLETETEDTSHYLIIPNRIIPFKEVGIADLIKWGGVKFINTQRLRVKYNNLRKKIKLKFGF